MREVRAPPISSSSFLSGVCIFLLGLVLVWTTAQQSWLQCSSRHLNDEDHSSSTIATIARTTSLTEEELEKFDNILSRASFRERTIILMTLNHAWAANGSMMDYFLESFRLGNGINNLLDHLVVVAMDEPSYRRCLAIHSHCFQMTTKGVDYTAEKGFMSKDYLRMTREKIFIMELVLRMGYSFVFTDGDVMWLRDPFQHFPADADLVMSCDYNHGNSTDIDNAPNTGFIFARASEKTIKLYRFWYTSHETYPGMHDQDVFKAIKGTETFRDIGLKVWFLPTGVFSGFCAPSGDFDKVVTVHSTCCVGLQRKLADIKVLLEDWKQYRMAAPQKVKWRVPKECRM